VNEERGERRRGVGEIMVGSGLILAHKEIQIPIISPPYGKMVENPKWE